MTTLLALVIAPFVVIGHPADCRRDGWQEEDLELLILPPSSQRSRHGI